MTTTATTAQLITAVKKLDLAATRQLLDSGLDVNTMDEETGTLISIVSDGLYSWWMEVSHGYETEQPLTEAQKTALLQPYLEMINLLIEKGANIHVWDSIERYGPLWDAASASCVPVVQLLLEKGVNPNTLDDEGLPILSSICQLFFDCDYDEVVFDEAFEEEKQTLNLLRQHDAKTVAELKAD